MNRRRGAGKKTHTSESNSQERPYYKGKVRGRRPRTYEGVAREGGGGTF
jgi:hypothetical protein